MWVVWAPAAAADPQGSEAGPLNSIPLKGPYEPCPRHFRDRSCIRAKFSVRSNIEIMKRTVPPLSPNRWYDVLIDAELILGGLAALSLMRWLTW